MNKGMIKMIIALLVIGGAVVAMIVAKNLYIARMIAEYAIPPATVSAEAVREEAWDDTVSAVGTLHASLGADLSAEVSGVVRDIAFVPGSDVQAGDSLIRLDDTVEEANLRSQEAQLRLAEINYERGKRLLASKAMSKTDFDTLEARLLETRALVESTRAIIDKKHIRAPFSGRAGVPLVKLGEYVLEGRALLTLQAPQNLYVEFSLPERFVQKLEPQQRVYFSVDTYPDRAFPAQVSAINTKVDGNTRSVLVRATVEPFEAELLPGMFASVRLVMAENVPVLTVPQTAVAYSLYGNSVFLIKTEQDDKGETHQVVDRVYVTPGERQGQRVAIHEGLKAGDLVVTAGQIKLANGTRIQIDNSVVLEGR